MSVKIIIEGNTRSGKSALARAIQNALQIANIQTVITGAEDEVAGVMDRTWSVRLGSLSGKVIEIATVRVNKTH